MDQFVPLVAAAALIYAAGNLLKMVWAGQVKESVTLMVTWLIAIAIAFLLRASDFASGIPVGDTLTLDQLNAWSTILFSVSLGGVANLAYDIIPKDTPTLGVTPSS